MPTTRDQVIADAQKWVGTMYKWGGDDESEGGVDCSGLILDAYRDTGLGQLFPGRPIASQIGQMGRAVTLEKAMPADVLYYDNPGPTDHVALYIGNGQMIEAPTVGQKVRVTAVRAPTSVRHFSFGSVEDPEVITKNGYQRVGDAVGDALGGWAGETMKIGIYVVGGLMAAGLVVAGVMQTVKKG